MSDIIYTRQLGFFNPDEHHTAATIVGCGGIGSFAAIALAKLGFDHFDLIDFDTVEAHNFPNQMFGPSNVGETKVGSLAGEISHFNPDANIDAHNRSLDAGPLPINPIIVSALDSMVWRKELWNLARMKLQCRLFIDGRLAGQKIIVYAARPSNMTDIEGYECTLYSDEEALDDSCTERSIIDVGFAVASIITRHARMALTGGYVPPVTYLNQETLQLERGDWL